MSFEDLFPQPPAPEQAAEPTDAPMPAELPADAMAPMDAPMPAELPADAIAPTDASASAESPADAIAPTDTPAPAESPAAPSPSVPELRAQLLRQFEQWLDRMLPDQLPPEGVPVEFIEQAQAAFGESGQQAADLYTVFSSLTCLSGEIRLQGRAFQRLTDLLASVSVMPEQLREIKTLQQTVVDQVAQLAEAKEQEENAQAVLPSSKDVLEVVFDLQGRLERAMQTLDQAMAGMQPDAGPGLLDRLLGRRPAAAAPRELLQSMHEGYGLTLGRLDGALHQWGIEQLAAPGVPFDPEQMTAVDVQVTADVEDGTVVEVYRHGYAIYDEILSTAQVKVAKAPANTQH